MNSLPFWQVSNTPNAIVNALAANIIADGGILEGATLQTEYNDLHSTIKKQASLALAGGAYRSGIVYGYNPQTSALIPFTFTRASIGTRVNKEGLLETVASGMPRMDYDPITRKFRGLLMERGNSNMALWSEDFTNASWQKNLATATLNTTVNPFGIAKSYYLSDDTSNNQHYTYQALTFTSGTTYSASHYVKKADDTWCQFLMSGTIFGTNVWINFNFDTGQFGTGGGSGIWDIKRLANGYYCVTVTATAIATGSGNIGVISGTNNTNTTRLPTYTGTGRKFCDAFAVQMETGQPTSYMPTVGVTATRAQDECSASVGAWYNTGAGTLYGMAIQSFDILAPSRSVASIALNITNRFGIYRQATSRLANSFSAPGTTQVINGGITTPNQYWKQAIGITSGTSFTGSSFGNIYGSAPSTTINLASLTSIVIGNNIVGGTSEYLDGWVKQVAYFQSQLVNTDLQSLTI